MIRDILDYQGNVLGQLELPDDTDEATWQAKLAPYAVQPPSIPTLIAAKLDSIQAYQKEWIAERFSHDDQMAFSILMMTSFIDGKLNRLAYVRQVWDWVQIAFGASIQAGQAVMGLKDQKSIEAFDFVLDNVMPPPPLVTLRGAIQIPD